MYMYVYVQCSSKSQSMSRSVHLLPFYRCLRVLETRVVMNWNCVPQGVRPFVKLAKIQQYKTVCSVCNWLVFVSLVSEF